MAWHQLLTANSDGKIEFHHPQRSTGTWREFFAWKHVERGFISPNDTILDVIRMMVKWLCFILNSVFSRSTLVYDLVSWAKATNRWTRNCRCPNECHTYRTLSDDEEAHGLVALRRAGRSTMFCAANLKCAQLKLRRARGPGWWTAPGAADERWCWSADPLFRVLLWVTENMGGS